MPGGNNTRRARQSRRQRSIDRRRWIMQVDNVRAQFPEGAGEAPRGVEEMGAHVRPHGKSFASHARADAPEGSDRQHARRMPLFALSLAHLRDQSLRSSHLHVVNYVNNLHCRVREPQEVTNWMIGH